jgi:hypothetical protein
LRALYWIEHRRETVNALFRELSHNSDGAARKVAVEMMEAADILECSEVELSPLPDELGSDLTSGRQERRLVFGGSVKAQGEQASK